MKVKSEVKSLSRVRLLATPWTAAYQAPPPMGFARQEYWSGVPLLLNKHKICGSQSGSEVALSCPTLCDSMDCSLPGFSVHGIFQARVLEWDAIAFSDRVTAIPIRIPIAFFIGIENNSKIFVEPQKAWNRQSNSEKE